ncbi:hypothetical protein [Sphingomonas bacterium]|uniref:hypothetical protein n=1 Tax=Sphingomonas bacterium TaxID=1895847 RepID=UPI0015771E8F|nr:hypothetical protein [Sphingomonas bacterium]
MPQKVSERPARGTRPKRAPRLKKGKSIIFRVTDEEDARLRREAGELGISGHIRSRVFSGGAWNRDALRTIAALHFLGRRVQRLAEHPAADAEVIATALGDVCAAIIRLADEVPEVDDEDAAAP